MLNKLLEKLYNKVFVNIVVDGGKTTLYIEHCANNEKFEILQNADATFETDSINAKMLAFIESYTKGSPYFYISILDNSLSQGAIPTCDKNRLSYYYDVSGSELKCADKKWTYFTSKTDLYSIEKKYEKIGVDFIFSPFTLLWHFFRDKIDKNLAMFVLIQTSSISVTVFKEGSLLFGEHLDMHHMLEEDGLSSENLDENFDSDESIDLEDVDVDGEEMELIDDFGDIEDLDAIEEIDEFAQHRDAEEELLEAVEEPKSSDENLGFNEEYQHFLLIQSSIASYYKDEKYDSSFIENIYIADNIGVQAELKKYLEEEMFVNVYIRQTNISMELCELAKRELEG